MVWWKTPKPLVITFHSAIVPEKLTVVRAEQSQNASSPILVTLSGMVILVRKQSSNAEFPILVTLSGMVILVRPEQPANAEFPIFVTR